jgi:hypothetical protein
MYTTLKSNSVLKISARRQNQNGQKCNFNVIPSLHTNSQNLSKFNMDALNRLVNYPPLLLALIPCGTHPPLRFTSCFCAHTFRFYVSIFVSPCERVSLSRTLFTNRHIMRERQTTMHCPLTNLCNQNSTSQVFPFPEDQNGMGFLRTSCTRRPQYLVCTCQEMRPWTNIACGKKMMISKSRFL